MAGKRDYYAVETQAHRDNYNAKDVEGRTLAEARGGEGYWREMYQAPEVLETGIDTTILLQNWRKNTSTTTTTTTSSKPITNANPSPIDTNDATPSDATTLPKGDLLRLSHDAGHYLCDFIYYTSLLEYWRREPKGMARGERPVVFLHVPGQADEESLGRGRQVAIGLIRALIETRNEAGRNGSQS